jgi:hypothetical protein
MQKRDMPLIGVVKGLIKILYPLIEPIRITPTLKYFAKSRPGPISPRLISHRIYGKLFLSSKYSLQVHQDSRIALLLSEPNQHNY